MFSVNPGMSSRAQPSAFLQRSCRCAGENHGRRSVDVSASPVASTRSARHVYRAAALHVPPRSSALPEAETDTETTAEMGTSMAKVWPLSPAATTAWSRRPA
ncbi:MAG: hypothetical protein QOF25_511 [Mycobacterium sp.]|jgi:hypothetical protein|nr:hypothetical protein [Mycobacterium sp.]